MKIDSKLENIQNSKWFVVQNDIIGGWDVSTINKSISYLTREETQTLPIVAECVFKEIAEEIVLAHNAGLVKQSE